ncbi:squalene/phytoene synthase family protein [Streptomyces roseirectus]|uniref:squalene/phytoene synthase family protein n=1 Tax=Streptomyces roseirectus TaxID=2768066 RepID=UPI001FE4842B|nr:squalene/phytoene synthase family protein [Streptomyces roseirectus]
MPGRGRRPIPRTPPGLQRTTAPGGRIPPDLVHRDPSAAAPARAPARPRGDRVHAPLRQPPRHRPAAAWQTWEHRVREALRTGTGDDALLRALAHTVATHPRMRDTVETYLTTAPAELDFTGFDDEADYQAYVDAYVLPAFMLIATLVAPEDDDGAFRAACRTFIDGSQRLDFVNDLAEDVREGRTGVPAQTLNRFSLTPENLTSPHHTDNIRQLVIHELTRARADLEHAAQLPTLAPKPFRPLLSALIEIELLTADAALQRGAALLQGEASPPPAGALRVLLNALRAKRTSRHP